MTYGLETSFVRVRTHRFASSLKLGWTGFGVEHHVRGDLPKTSIFVANGGYNGVQQALTSASLSSPRARPKISHMSPHASLGAEPGST